MQAGLTAGPVEREIIHINGVRMAIVICADEGNEAVHKHLAATGVEFLFVPTGGGGNVADMLHEQDLAAPDSAERYREAREKVFITTPTVPDKWGLGIGFAAANAVGPVGEKTCHQGHCMIVDSGRVVRAQTPGTIVLEHMQDRLIHAKLDF